MDNRLPAYTYFEANEMENKEFILILYWESPYSHEKYSISHNPR